MVEGALLAIPPNATEQSLGLTTAPGKKLFHALQDYGGYIVDDAADPSYNLAVENGVKQEFLAVYGYDFGFYDDGLFHGGFYGHDGGFHGGGHR